MKLLSAVLGSLLCTTSSLALADNKPVVERFILGEPFKHPEIERRAHSYLLNDKSKPFAVDGKNIPEVDYDVGESYAGLLPVSQDPDETRKLFFWFFPIAQNEVPKEITIWLNGGPGCSSLSGMLTENGPFLWAAGTKAPVRNTYSWTNLTNMLWIEQPVGVGYTEGEPNIINEVELSREFIGFYKNFVNLFALQGWKTYLMGESYAGRYVPYIADAFLSANDTQYYNLAGISINDPVIGDDVIHQQVVVLPYAKYWNNLLYYNDTFMAETEEINKACGYTDYYEKYFTFPPPPGPFPELPSPYAAPNGTVNETCCMIDRLYAASGWNQPCFNVYHITDQCPLLSSETGYLFEHDIVQRGSEVYFNRTDVKLALHADVDVNWVQCTQFNVFGNGNATSTIPDASLPPTKNGVMQRVIEATNNTLIGSGDLDMLVATNGTLLNLQNLTWHGVQGLSAYPSNPLIIAPFSEGQVLTVSGDTLQGVWTKERGLTFYTAHLAGHMLPGYAPGVGFRMMQVLLGHIEGFDSEEMPWPILQFGGGNSTSSSSGVTGDSKGRVQQGDRRMRTLKDSLRFTGGLWGF